MDAKDEEIFRLQQLVIKASSKLHQKDMEETVQNSRGTWMAYEQLKQKDEEIFRLQQLQYAAEAEIERLEKKTAKPKKKPRKASQEIRLQSDPTIWVVAFPDGGCYAGKQIRKFDTEVEIELLDAVMLAGCGLAGEGTLTGETRRFPVSECRFFNDLQAMGTCVLRSCAAHNSR